MSSKKRSILETRTIWRRHINDRRRGRLQLYIVIQERVRLMANKDAIAEVEEFLIGHAARRNPNLLNIHGTGPSNWTIAGVANHRRNGPDLSVVLFKEYAGHQEKARCDGDARYGRHRTVQLRERTSKR